MWRGRKRRNESAACPADLPPKLIAKLQTKKCPPPLLRSAHPQPPLAMGKGGAWFACRAVLGSQSVSPPSPERQGLVNLLQHSSNAPWSKTYKGKCIDGQENALAREMEPDHDQSHLLTFL